jgi:hypothetical protein
MMSLYEIAGDGLVPFRQLRGGSDLYEAEIESLLWDNLDELTGEVLFPVRRQAAISGGGRPDIVALDSTGGVVVIEVKRDVDRSQLAQCLEYAGWGRATNLDEMAGLYHAGAERFWPDWMTFTETEEPRRVSRSPRLILVARDFDGRTNSALEFLQDNGLPITVIRVAIFEDVTGRRFLDIEGIEEPQLPASEGASAPAAVTRRRARHNATIPDLIGAGLLDVEEKLEWVRPRTNTTLTCHVTVDGRLRLPDGSVYGSPSGAATAAARGGSFDGWEAWRATGHGRRLLDDLRREYLDRSGPVPSDDAAGLVIPVALDSDVQP